MFARTYLSRLVRSGDDGDASVHVAALEVVGDDGVALTHLRQRVPLCTKHDISQIAKITNNKEKLTAPVIRIAAPSVSRGRRMRCDVAALARDIVASISEIQKDASRSNRELVSTRLRKSRKMEASRS